MTKEAHPPKHIDCGRFSSVMIDHKAAHKFTPHLLKSVEMCEFVDQKIKLP